MKKLLIILGLCLFTAGTQAVPTLDIEVTQGPVILDIVITPVDFPEDTTQMRYTFDSMFGGVLSFARDGGVFHWTIHLTEYLGLQDGATVHVRGESYYEPEFFAETSFDVAPYTPVPDGGATGLLLGCGFFALAGGRHLLNRRTL